MDARYTIMKRVLVICERCNDEFEHFTRTPKKTKHYCDSCLRIRQKEYRDKRKEKQNAE